MHAICAMSCVPHLTWPPANCSCPSRPDATCLCSCQLLQHPPSFPLPLPPTLLQLWYPLTLTPWAAILTTVSQAALLALPFSQLFVSPEDRGRVWRDFRVRPGACA